jgi:cytoskeleton protein RodZ
VLAGLLLLLGALVLIFLPAIKTGVNDVKSELMSIRQTGAFVTGDKGSIVLIPTAESDKPPSVLQSIAGLMPVAPPPASNEASSFVQASSSVTPSATAANPSSNLKPSITASASSPVAISSSKVLAAGVSVGASSPTFVVAPKPPSDADVIVFKAKGQSWIEATDAKGQVVLRRVLNAGEVTGAAGALPLKVVIGRADETLVQVRGKAFDLSAVAKDNVARFEVK